MKKLLVVVAFLVVGSTMAFAGQWSGYISDEMCAKPGRHGTRQLSVIAVYIRRDFFLIAPAVLVTNILYDDPFTSVRDCAQRFSLIGEHVFHFEVDG